MRWAFVWLVLLVGCRREAASECPPEATVDVVTVGSGDDERTRTTCRWAGNEIVSETDGHGDLVLRTSRRGGTLDGLQLERSSDLFGEVRTEASYRLGVLHGPQRRLRGGELVAECAFVEGARDGRCWDRDRLGQNVEHYDRGRRTGLWSSGDGLTTRIYGADTLLAINGTPVPLPPASLEVFGEIVERASCPRHPGDPCSRLFDEYRLCELGVQDRVGCQLRAMERYAHDRP